MTLIAWIFLIAIVWLIAFYRWPSKIALPVIALFLLAVSYFQIFSIASLTIVWAIWCVAALLIFMRPLRFYVLTVPFLHWFQRENPPLSAAEQQVINAGGVWWGDQLFSGEPDWREILSGKKLVLTPAEQNFLDHQVVQLCDLLDEWRISYQDYDLSPEAWEMIKKEKFWALEMDPKYGGHGFSPFAHSAIIGKIAARSVSAAIMIMVPNSLGPAEFLKYYGTQAQKEYYLPRLAKGEEIACFALTGVEAGSDAAAITDTGVVCRGEYGGKNVLGVRLNWNKRYITLAPIATLVGLAFRLLDPEGLLGKSEDIGVTLALIPSHLPGVERGARHFPLNMGFMNGPIRGQDVFIPLENIIGGAEQCGRGWQMMMECLVVGRGISLPSLSAAISQFCMRTTSAYAKVRCQFQRPIIEFEGVQQSLGRITGLSYLSEAMRLCILESIQMGKKPAVASAITKYWMTEFARQIVADAMDIHGGYGIQLGPRNYLGYLNNAIPINITVEGANILTRSLIIYGQGLMRCHPFLNAELKAAMAKDLPEFDRTLRRHFSFTFSHFSRLIIYGITGGRWISTNMPAIERKYFQQLTRMANALVILTDVTLLILGKRLKIKESLSARLGDAYSHLYMGTAVLKHHAGRGSPEDERVLMEWSVCYCLEKIQRAMIDFLSNFPKPWIGRILKRLIFPWGHSYRIPHDALTLTLAKSVSQNAALRERLSALCYFSPGSASWKIEEAWKRLMEAAPLFAKIQSVNKADIPLPSLSESYLSAQIRAAYEQKKITTDERDQLQAVANLCWNAIQVDEFQIGGERGWG